MQHGEGPITIRPGLLKTAEDTEDDDVSQRRPHILDPTAHNLQQKFDWLPLDFIGASVPDEIHKNPSATAISNDKSA